MDSITSWLQDVKQTLSTKSSSSEEDDRHRPEASEEPLKEIDVIRVLEAQVRNIYAGIQIFVDDMEEAVELEEQTKTLLAEIKESTNDVFDTWSRHMQAGIRDQTLR